MAKTKNNFLNQFVSGIQNTTKSAVNSVSEAVDNVVPDEVKEQTAKAADAAGKKAKEAKEAAEKLQKQINDKITALDRELDAEVTNYNDAYTLMSDCGTQLFIERTRTSDSITFVEGLINSIANHPKEFDKDFETINSDRQKFNDSEVYADREIQNARKAAGEAGAGLAAGASVAFMGPTAAMWVATTFGTASTGAAISTLSGAAATNAALAWLGGGTLAAGGGGMAAGNAFLALAGPVGWGIAGASLLASIIIFEKNKMKSQKQKKEDIERVKRNTTIIKKMHGEIDNLLASTKSTHALLNQEYISCISLYGGDYSTFTHDQKLKLGSLVNNTKAAAALMDKTLAVESDD